MLLRDICSVVEGEVVCGKERLDENMDYGFASDLMSDVLTLKSENFILLTGLANLQSVRTAEMSDLSCMIICRGKKSTEEMIELAEDNEIMIIESPMSLFKCSGLLYNAGLKPLF